VLILVGLLSQKCGLWPKPETPTETLPAVTPQEPTATFTIQPTPTSTFPPTPTATPRPGDTWTRPTDGMVMVYVPAGEFALGSDDDDVEDVFQLCTQYRHNCQRAWFEDEQPVRRVALDAFWIDQTEVTNAQFAAFVDDTGYETDAEREGWGRVWTGSRWEQVAGADWQHPEGPDSSAHDDHPVVQVSWNDAVAYCEWAGARLPTEAEWEKAARGTDGRLWPWGSKWDPDRCNSREDGFGRTTPVEQYSPIGDSPYGAADMAGNVWEWCSSLYEPYPYDPSDGRENPEAEGSRVLRGGSWISFPDPLHSAFRDKEQPDFRRDNYGFRCVRDSD